jgi:HPt (histidine-containing phosphotransfer) domain-containing protein
VEAGMVDFVSKPIEPDAFYAVLLKWLQTRRMESGSATSLPGHSESTLNASVNAPNSQAEMLAEFPGLDVERGLITWRKSDSYKRFLRKFVEDYAEVIHALVSNPDHLGSGISAFVHKLKGAAATLAIVDVARIASSIEQTIKAGDSGAPLVQDLGNAFAIAGMSIAAYAPSELVTESDGVLTAAQRVQVAKLLLPLLQAIDADNLDQSEQLLTELEAVLPASQCQLIHATLNDFDFRGAEAAARQVAENLNISLDR